MDIDGKTRLLGLIGHPVEHTMSPLIHNNLSKMLKLNEVYVPFSVEEGHVENALKGGYSLNVLGMNVTVPYKQAVIPYLTEIDEAAKAIGAVNTLVRVESGYRGYNTDMLGLLREVKSEGICIKGSSVIILGAGGAARAAAYMCMSEGASHIIIINRTLEKAIAIRDDMNKEFDKDIIEAMALSDYRLEDIDDYIAFQTTSIGLSPHKEEVIIADKDFYKHIAIGVDIIYNPARTKFMTMVEEAKGKAYNGLKMLLYQGVIAYELWNNISIPETRVDKVYQLIKSTIYGNTDNSIVSVKADNIVLIGYMGAGKTTIGTTYAKEQHMNFIDTDAYIEAKEGMSISDIFAAKGEDYFRNLEGKVVEEMILTTTNTVISTGGGLPLNKKVKPILNRLGKVIYLQASTATIWERVKAFDNRPLLKCDNPYERICTMLAERSPIYELVSDVVLDVDSKTIEEIILEISELGC